MRRRYCLLSLLLLSALDGCAARSRMGEALVHQKDGAPCFAIENTRATRTGEPVLRAITVNVESGAQRGKEVWGFMVEPSSSGLPITPEHCTSYGQAPAGTRVLQQPIPLVPGTLYSVTIYARVKDPADPTFAYTAEFCVIAQSGSAFRVHQVRWDAKAGRWQREVCGAEAPTRDQGEGR